MRKWVLPIPKPSSSSPTREDKALGSPSPGIPAPSLPVLVGAEDGNQVNSFLFNGSLEERRGTEGGGGAEEGTLKV